MHTEKKATEVAPKVPEAPIEEEKAIGVALEAAEIPTQDDVAGPGEDLSAVGTEAREAPIAEEEAAEGALRVKETEGPSVLGEEAAAIVDKRDLLVAAGIEEAIVELEASLVSSKKVRVQVLEERGVFKQSCEELRAEGIWQDVK